MLGYLLDGDETQPFFSIIENTSTTHKMIKTEKHLGFHYCLLLLFVVVSLGF